MDSETVAYSLNALTEISQGYDTVSEYPEGTYNYHKFRTESLEDDGE